MNLQGLNLKFITNNLKEINKNVHCHECYKYYVLPTFAACGHAVCNTCWVGKRECPQCSMPVAKNDLQICTLLTKRTNNVKQLIKVFEKMFNIKLKNFFMDVKKDETGDDSNKNVKDWLTNSQNKFFIPITSQLIQENPHHKSISSEIQIHTPNVKTDNISNVVIASNPQDDYDKIEPMSENLQYIVPDNQNTQPVDIDTFTNNINTPENTQNNDGNKETITTCNTKTLETRDTFSVKTTKVKFFKKSALHNVAKENLLIIDDKQNNEIESDDIGISIRFGKTVTNLCIKKNKENGAQLKIFSDKETQTSPGNEKIVFNNVSNINKTKSNFQKNMVTTSSPNKNTESAETGSAQFQITESVDNELFDIMETDENEFIQKTSKIQIADETENHLKLSQKQSDLDICESQRASTIQILKSVKKASSDILVPIRNHIQKRKQLDKTSLYSNCNEDLPQPKKQKTFRDDNYKSKIEINNVNKKNRSMIIVTDSDCNNYEPEVDKVFTVFSGHDILKSPHGNVEPSPLCTELVSLEDGRNNAAGNLEEEVPGTPCNDNSDSDKSVVEETPQKNVSLQKTKLNQSTSFKSDIGTRRHTKLPSVNEDFIANVINLTDSINNSAKRKKHSVVLKKNKDNENVETPANIKMFVDQIKLKSTPLARKSLNFNGVNIEPDPDRTLCPSQLAVATTTQEKEFMNEVFEQSPLSSVNTILIPQLRKVAQVKYCVAGTCLTASELIELKILCKQRGWTYVNNYTKDLTHLVTAVDEDNKSQRTMKYIRALAAGKWIVSYAWVEKCMQTKTFLKEESFECLDVMGEPGPRRSRLAKRKLFDGITFFCMQPFSLLDVDIFKEILEAAGGRVVSELREIHLVNEKPALLLAEPEHTQEDRFIYLAMEHKIVPVNCEWAISCLGSYVLNSIMELLLCPSSLLPPVTSKWPAPLIAQDID